MKYLKWLGVSILLIVALFFIVPIFLPSSYHVERSINIERSVDMVFQTAVNMNLRSKWDPWIEMDPKAEMNVFMTPEVIGSGYSWNGEIIGKGEIKLKEFVPNEIIKSEIEFFTPQSTKADIIWTFTPVKSGTDITWAFEGNLSYPIEKWVGLFMDKSLGTSFEKGLKNFKKLVESLPNINGRTGEISKSYFKGLKAISITGQCDTKKLSSKMFDMYTTLFAYLKNNNIEMIGSPLAIYHEFDINGKTTLECGLQVDKKVKGEGEIRYMEIPACNVVTASHFGHFKTVKNTYVAIQKYIKENNLEITGTPWELYITDPMKEPDQNKWETQVYFPIKDK